MFCKETLLILSPKYYHKNAADLDTQVRIKDCLPLPLLSLGVVGLLHRGPRLIATPKTTITNAIPSAFG